MDIETLTQKITWGGRFAKVEDGLGRLHFVVLRTPTLQDKQFIDFIYTDAIREAKEMGCITGLELSKEYQRKGIWTHSDENRIKEAKEAIEELEEIIKVEKNSRKKAILSKSLEGRTNALDELRSKRYQLFAQTAERHADGVKTRAIVYCSTYTEEGEKYWPSWDVFQREPDRRFIENIIGALNEVERIPNKKIREIARSGYWRIHWNAAKTIGDLFGKPIVELDAEQNALVYWSQVYDYVYEHPDRPDSDVIANDDALDAWFDNEERKKKVERVTKGESASGVKLGNKVSRHGEIFIVANPAINPNAPTTQDIENLNDGLTRTFKAKEAERIKEKGMLKETELRDRKNKIARKIIGSTDAVITKKNSFGQARGGKSAGKQYPGGTIG